MKLSRSMQQVLDNAKREYGTMFESPESKLTHRDTVNALWDANSKTLEALKSRGLIVVLMRDIDGIQCMYFYLTQQGYTLGNAEDAEVSRKNVCPKCGGTGYIRQYSHVSGGICFHCNGTGKIR